MDDLRIDVNSLISIFKDNGCHVPLPDKYQINDIAFLSSKEHFREMMDRFEGGVIAIVLKYFENKEHYEVCAKIKSDIENHNKLNGGFVKTSIPPCK